MSEVEEIVLNTLKEVGKPLRPGEIAERTGLDKKVIDKAIKKLRKEGKVISPKRCYYSLP